MNLKDIEKFKNYECIAGSIAYNLHTEDSDEDIRGIFTLPTNYHLSLSEPPKEVSDESQDIKFYELKKFMNLATDCNPNIIEILYMPDNVITYKDDVMNELMRNRHLFLSKKARYTFGGYAFSQIKRSKSLNKKINSSLTSGLYKLKKLLSEDKITCEWIKERFSKEVADAVLKL